MKIFNSILFFLCAGINLLAQNVVYQPIFINPCTEKQEDVYLWELHDSSSVYYSSIEFFEGKEEFREEGVWEKTYALERGGSYQLYVEGIYSDFEPVQVYLIQGLNKDTFFFPPKLSHVSTSVGPYSEYQYCSEIAHGYQIDYYYNGIVRMKSFFENGQPIDSVFHYDRLGNIQELSIYSTDGEILKSYDYYENGSLKKKSNYTKSEKEGVFDIETEMFYLNGMLKSKSTKDKFYTYYDNGDLKGKILPNKKVMFNKKGIIVEKITKKEILIKERKETNEYFYEYKWMLRDSLNEKKILIKYYEFGSPLWGHYPVHINDLDDYNPSVIIRYKKGKPYRKIDKTYVKENDNRVEKILLFEFVNKKWVEKERIPLTDLSTVMQSFLDINLK